MRFGIFIFLLFSSWVTFGQSHCGYDFTSYLVLHIHENGKSTSIKNLKTTIIDSVGNEVINIDNRYSWTHSNEPMVFTMNYKIDDKGARVTDATAADASGRWFFPFAKEDYLLSVSNSFPAERFSLKIEDIDGDQNGGHFETQIVQLNSFNMYVLCSSENERQAARFGPRTNRPVDVILELKKK